MKFERLRKLPFPELDEGNGPETPLRAEIPLRLPLLPEEPFDAASTFRCGQIFRWHPHGDTWYGPYRTGSLAVRPLAGALEVRALDVEITAGEAWRFLGLDTSLAEVHRALSFDRWVRTAIEQYPGLRILRQDPWECVAGYICSQWNNIPKIELSTGRLARSWGAVHRWPEGIEIGSFPPPEALAAHTPEEIRECALGYRCGYLIDSARHVATGEIDLEALRGIAYDEALAAVLRLPGVGRKVADCILLFSLDQPQSCPIDVWVRRVIHELYPRAVTRILPDARERAEKGLSTREYAALLQFAWERWGMLAGYAQQYLFHARRQGTIGPGAQKEIDPSETG